MSEELYQRFSDAVERMPAFPESVHRVLELTSDLACSPKDLVAVIEHDPVMTAKILKLVNSAYFGLSREILNINHAVVFTGINTVKNLALGIATIGALPRENQAGLDIDRFLRHSLATAAVTRLLGKHQGVPENQLSDYFVAGLLHDFGKVVLALFMPDPFRQALERAKESHGPLYLAEQEVIGSDHAEIGAMLCERWGLPGLLARVARDHHAMKSEATLLRDCLFVADQLTKLIGAGDAGSPEIQPLPAEVRERFGMELPELLESLGDLEEELNKVSVFTQL